MYAGAFVKELPEEDSDYLPQSKSAEDVIKSEFLESQLNIQASLSRSQALARTVHVDIPKSANESDKIFANIPRNEIKSDRQLSHVSLGDRAVVADYLKGLRQ